MSLNISLEKNEPDWLMQDRKRAIEQFNLLKFPEFKYGLSIKLKIPEIDFSKITPEDSNLEIIAPKEVKVLQLNDSLNNQEVQENLFITSQITNKLEAFHRAFWNQGILIIIPKGKIIQEPIKIKLSPTNSIVNNILVIAESESQATIIEELSESKEYFSNYVEIIAQDCSRINYFSVQKLNKDVFYFATKRSIIKSSALLNWFDFNIGGRYIVSETSSFLGEKGAETNILGLFYGSNEQQLDIASRAVHAAPHTKSDMFTRGAMNDDSKSVYRGVVKIQSNANNSNGYQKEDVILLSKNAEANAVPELKIDNNDVRCTHGATIGQIDKEKMFYLMSRGICESDAKKIIVHGFFEQVLKKIENKDLYGEFNKIIENDITN